MHDAVVISTGMPSSKMLNIPGEDLKNCITASKFVGWYNGDPSYSPSDVDLSNVRRAAVIGNGNVALDVARVLLKPWTSFIGTDMSQSALEALKTAEIQQVDIIGRRGPLQVCY